MKTLRFDSFEAFLDSAQIVPSQQDSSSSRTSKNGDWAGTKTFGEAVELAKRGWAEGAAKALALRGSIDAAVREIVAARQAQYSWDVTGDSIDVGKYLTGEPECCITQTPDGDSVSSKVVKLCANLAASGSVSVKSLYARGAVILSAIDILESLGHRVELWIAHASRGSKGIIQQFAMVKPASQPLEADRVAYCLCHAACLRRLAFSNMEQHGWLPNSTYPNAVQFDGDAVVTNEAYRGSDFSPEELLAEVAALCEKCGVSIPADEIAALVS